MRIINRAHSTVKILNIFQARNEKKNHPIFYSEKDKHIPDPIDLLAYGYKCRKNN